MFVGVPYNYQDSHKINAILVSVWSRSRALAGNPDPITKSRLAIQMTSEDKHKMCPQELESLDDKMLQV